MTKSEAARLVAVVLAAYPTHASKLNGEQQLAMADAWAMLLGDLTYEQASRAIAAVVQTSPFLPAIAEIRAAAVELECGAIAGGVEAWGAVLDAARRYGAYRTPGVDFAFADPLVGECVALMSWQSLCASENPVADRARFVELYDGMAKQDRRERQAPVLAEAHAERAQRAVSAGATVLQLLPRNDASEPENAS